MTMAQNINAGRCSALDFAVRLSIWLVFCSNEAAALKIKWQAGATLLAAAAQRGDEPMVRLLVEDRTKG